MDLRAVGYQFPFSPHNNATQKANFWHYTAARHEL